MSVAQSGQPVPRRGRLASLLPWLPTTTAAVALLATAWRLRDLPPTLPLDDAYITLHGARALLAGGDSSYGSPILSGITSAPHLLLVAAAQLVAPGEPGVLGLAWLALALYASGLVRLAQGFRVGAAWQALLVLAGLSAGKLLPYHGLNGLETGLALGTFAWTLALLREASPPDASSPRVALALLLGVLPFLRPELAVFSAAVFVHRLARTHSAADPARARRAWLREVALALLAAAPWALWYGLSTGTPWPSSAVIKSAFRAESCLPLSTRLGELGGGLVEQLPGAIVVGVVFLPFEAVGLAGLAAIGAFLLTALQVFPFATQMQDGRYTVLFVPVLVLGLGLGLRADRRGLRRAAQALLVLATLYDLARLPESFAQVRDARLFARDELGALATWMNRRLPADARVLVHDAGFVAFATPFALIDVVGLKTPSSAELHRRITWPSCGAHRGAAVAAIAASGRATHLVTLAQWEQTYGFAAALAGAGWRVDLLRDGHTGYSVYALHPPAAQGN